MSASPQSLHRYTVADLYRPEFDGKRVEIWEGELHYMAPAGRPHNRIAVEIMVAFRELRSSRPELAIMNPGDGCTISTEHEETFLLPDTGLFLRAGRTTKPLLVGAPELVVEVDSPSNTFREFARKRRLYFAGGAEQFWLVSPEERQIEVFFNDGRHAVISGDALIGEGIALGLVLPLGPVFAAADEEL